MKTITQLLEATWSANPDKVGRTVQLAKDGFVDFTASCTTSHSIVTLAQGATPAKAVDALYQKLVFKKIIKEDI